MELLEICKGCTKIVDGVCSVYEFPKEKIQMGGCAFAPKTPVKETKQTVMTGRFSKAKHFAVSKYRRTKRG